jgi:hypothetical protein
MPLKPTPEVVREMQAKGHTLVHTELELKTTPGRAARALRALGAPAIIRKSVTVMQPVIGGHKRKVLTLWTSAEGLEQLRAVVLAAGLAGKSLARTDRFTLAEVARLMAEEPGSLGELRAAHALDAPEVHLEAMVWNVRCRLVKTYGEKRP